MCGLDIADEAALARLATRLAGVVKPGTTITLSGELAAGKTTFARGFLRALGYPGKVKSPTFTLVETYELPDFTVHHFDLYRLTEPGELYYLGFDDYQRPDTVCLIEWPARGGDLLAADLQLTLDILGPTRRRVSARAGSPLGTPLLAMITEPVVTGP